MADENTGLVVIDIKPESYPTLYVTNGLDKYLNQIRQAVNEVPDVTTAKGRARIASLAASASRSKTAIEKPGREYLRHLKEQPKIIEAGQVETKTGLVRDYYDEARRNVLTQIESLKKVEFINSSYLDLDIPDNSVIYCDPPYKGTKKYRYNIDHEQFWQWVREKSANNDVYVSEYEAPTDFVCIWQKQVSSSLRANGVIEGAKSNIERLFIHESKLVEGNADAE